MSKRDDDDDPQTMCKWQMKLESWTRLSLCSYLWKTLGMMLRQISNICRSVFHCVSDSIKQHNKSRPLSKVCQHWTIKSIGHHGYIVQDLKHDAWHSEDNMETSKLPVTPGFHLTSRSWWIVLSTSCSTATPMQTPICTTPWCSGCTISPVTKNEEWKHDVNDKQATTKPCEVRPRVLISSPAFQMRCVIKQTDQRFNCANHVEICCNKFACLWQEQNSKNKWDRTTTNNNTVWMHTTSVRHFACNSNRSADNKWPVDLQAFTNRRSVAMNLFCTDTQMHFTRVSWMEEITCRESTTNKTKSHSRGCMKTLHCALRAAAWSIIVSIRIACK